MQSQTLRKCAYAECWNRLLNQLMWHLRKLPISRTRLCNMAYRTALNNNGWSPVIFFILSAEGILFLRSVSQHRIRSGDYFENDPLDYFCLHSEMSQSLSLRVFNPKRNLNFLRKGGNQFFTVLNKSVSSTVCLGEKNLSFCMLSKQLQTVRSDSRKDERRERLHNRS